MFYPKHNPLNKTVSWTSDVSMIELMMVEAPRRVKLQTKKETIKYSNSFWHCYFRFVFRPTILLLSLPLVSSILLLFNLNRTPTLVRWHELYDDCCCSRCIHYSWKRYMRRRRRRTASPFNRGISKCIARRDGPPLVSTFPSQWRWLPVHFCPWRLRAVCSNI